MDQPPSEVSHPKSENESDEREDPNLDRSIGADDESNLELTWEQDEGVVLETPGDSEQLSYRPDTSLPLESLSLAESELFGTFGAIERWQESANDDHAPPDESKIKAIYQASLGYYSILLSQLPYVPRVTEENFSELRRGLSVFRQWGEMYSVTDGALDHLAKHDNDVGDTILLLLVEMSSILCQRFPAFIEGLTGRQISVFARATDHLQALVSHLKRCDEDDVELHEDDPVGGIDHEQDSMAQCLTELHEYIQLLNELHPTIESYLPPAEDIPGSSLKEATERGAYLYFSDMVRSKYPKVSDTLADLLGQVNLDRFNRMAGDRETNMTEDVDINEVPKAASVGPKSSSFHDSGIGSSIPPTIPPSMSTTRSLAPTLFSALAGKSRSRLPPFTKSNQDRHITCDYCGKTVRFRTKHDWERHLIQDLQPYSCLETDCPKSIKAFKDRTEWMEHLGKDHKMSPEWNPVQCHLCQEWTEGRMMNVCRHLADHLVDIALAASPLNLNSDDGEDGSSSPEVAEKIEDNARNLQPISEELVLDPEEEDKTIDALSDEADDETEMEERNRLWTSPKALQVSSDPSRNQSSPGKSKPDRIKKQVLSPAIKTKSGSKVKLPPLPPISEGPKNRGLDIAPNCAICDAPAFPECPCESERLQIAVAQAEKRALDSKLFEARAWVISHSRHHVIKAFEGKSTRRKESHQAHLVSLPNYDIYMKYSGHPPISPILLTQLQSQIRDAHAELKRGIDADWRACVLRYPETLDYFYSLIEWHIPVVNAALNVPSTGIWGSSTKVPVVKKSRRRDRKGAVGMTDDMLEDDSTIGPPGTPHRAVSPF